MFEGYFLQTGGKAAATVHLAWLTSPQGYLLVIVPIACAVPFYGQCHSLLVQQGTELCLFGDKVVTWLGRQNQLFILLLWILLLLLRLCARNTWLKGSVKLKGECAGETTDFAVCDSGGYSLPQVCDGIFCCFLMLLFPVAPLYAWCGRSWILAACATVGLLGTIGHFRTRLSRPDSSEREVLEGAGSSTHGATQAIAITGKGNMRFHFYVLYTWCTLLLIYEVFFFGVVAIVVSVTLLCLVLLKIPLVLGYVSCSLEPL